MRTTNCRGCQSSAAKHSCELANAMEPSPELSQFGWTVDAESDGGSANSAQRPAVRRGSGLLVRRADSVRTLCDCRLARCSGASLYAGSGLDLDSVFAHPARRAELLQPDYRRRGAAIRGAAAGCASSGRPALTACESAGACWGWRRRESTHMPSCCSIPSTDRTSATPAGES